MIWMEINSCHVIYVLRLSTIWHATSRTTLLILESVYAYDQ